MTSEHSQKENPESQQPPIDDLDKKQNTNLYQILIINLPETATEENLRKSLENCGKISNIEIDQSEGGKPRGMAKVDFEEKEAKERALKDQIEIDGKILKIKDANTLYVGNVPYSAKKEDLIKFFGDIGKVEIDFATINDKFKGYAYATFPDQETLELALKKNGQKLDNRELKIELIKPRDLSEGFRIRRGGFRGRGRDRGRGRPHIGHFERERHDDFYRERRDKDRMYDRSRDRVRDFKYRDNDYDREKEYRERDRERERERDRNRERDRDREWMRERRERSRDRSKEYRMRDRERRDRGDKDRDRRREFERGKERIERDRSNGNRDERDGERHRYMDRERRHSNYNNM